MTSKKTIYWMIIFAFIIWFAIIIGVRADVSMDTVMHIESRGNPNAFNRQGRARGLFQITPICLKEWNTFNKPDYNLDDLYNPSVNRKIAHWYMNVRIPEMLRHYGIKVNTVNKLWAYHGGISRVQSGEMSRATAQYIDNYFSVRNRLGP